jgi:hypothetical protein
MNEPVENKPVELSQEETKEVVGGATAITHGLLAAGISEGIIAAVNNPNLQAELKALQAKLK